MNLDKPADKKAQSKGRDNWATSVGRKPAGTFNKTVRQQSQSSKSIVNSLEHKGKSNTGSDCGSVRKIKRPVKDAGFKTIKNKVLGVDKQNKKESSTTLKQTQLIHSLKKFKPVSTLDTPRTNNLAQQYMKHQSIRQHSNSQTKLNMKSHTSSIKIAPQTPPKPITLDNFEVGKKLGKGRFGDVHMVREKRTGFIMAMKSINKHQLRESDMFGQLYFEIKLQSFISHPNALKMYGYFQDEKNIYLLLELASHSCMFRELKSKGCFREDQAAYYLRQVIAAIKNLHSHCIMHRDIKPQNILNSFGVLKLCDFGWAVYSPLYQRQTFCGTLDYVPPQIVTGEFYDEKVDLWCIGVLCYELCTGHAPFEAKDDQLETYDRILSLDLQFPVNLSHEVVDFISKLLTKDPQARMGFSEMEEHPFMKKYENQSGRLISKEIWESWHNLR